MRHYTALLALLGVLLACHCHADLTSSEKTTINEGLEFGGKVAETLASLGDPKTSKIFKSIGKLASFLGAAGGFISFALVFLPTKDSAELTYMKKQFTLVNTKLDKVTSKLDDIKSLITYENQRAAYVSSSHAILYGRKQLLKFITEVQKAKCATKSVCKRIRARIASRYLRSLNVKKHLDKILRGTVSRTSVFGDPLLSLVSRTSKCNFAKINSFVNDILTLAFKGQQVVLAYEKLSGSKHSITQSMNDWLTNIYRLRSASYVVKNKCFRRIKQLLLKDIQNSDYQIKSPTNAAANRAVKSFLEKKYPWLEVVVFSYQAYGSSVHCNTDVYGGLRNMPKNKNARKRNIIVGIADKKGTYMRQKYDVLNALDGIARNMEFYNERIDYCNIIRKLTTELKKKNVWKYIASLSIRKNEGSLNVLGDDDAKYIFKTYHFRWRIHNGIHNLKFSIPARMVIILKSTEQAKERRCNLACKNGGSCILYPYSSSQYCQCKPFYQGNLCEEHSKAQLAKTVDSMLAVTLKLPVLSDVHFDIKDLRRFVGVSFGNMQKSISNLESSMQRKFNQLSKTVKDQFKWANFITMYREAIQTIRYYAHRFERLPKEYKDNKKLEKHGEKLAAAVLHAHYGIRKALFQLNSLLVGNVNKPLLKHKPILLAFMESRSKAGEPCTASYKRRVDNYWRQLLLLQQIGYMMWAQALEFVNEKTTIVSRYYNSRIRKQLNAIKRGTCQYDIRHSINVHCNKYYLHPGMTIRNRCNSGYYVHGSLQTSCKRQRSSCQACNCYRYGSTSQRCSNIHGTCSCKRGFKGKKCSNRDCVWSKWSRYGSCPCGYGSRERRSRTVKVAAVGSGKRCEGPSTSYRSCFIGCCRNQFHCSNRRKCIPASYKCDYDNDCGDNQDEKHCNERCYTRYTGYSDHGGGVLIFLDRQRFSCRNGESLKQFGMQRYSNKIRYQYTCCKFNKLICSNKKKYNPYTYAIHSSNANYLGRQRVFCGSNGYISSLSLRRSSNHKAIRYEYNCCQLRYQRYRKRTSCYSRHTSWTTNAHEKSYALFRQNVKCSSRYFLNEFRLQNKYRSWGRTGYFRYYYRCCRVKS